MRRLLRAAAALALVPLVVFANPAHAAVTPGPWKTVKVVVPIEPLADSFQMISCTFSAQHAGTHVNVAGNGYCVGTPDVTPGYTQPAEAGSSYAITFKGQDRAQYGGCTASTGGTLGPNDRNGTVRVAGTINASTAQFGASDQCDVTDVCVQLKDDYKCVEFLLPYPDDTPPSSSCPAGTPHAFFEVTQTREGDYIYEETFLNIEITGNTLGSARQWGVAFTGIQASTQTGGPYNTDRIHVRVKDTYKGLGSPPSYPANPGIQVYAFIPEPPDQNRYWNSAPIDYGASSVPTRFPLTANDPYMGVTDSNQCRWYFGQRIIDDPNSDQDTPFGTGLDPDPPPPLAEEPPVLDPPELIEEPEEGYNWLSAIWAVLKVISSSIANLAVAIVSGVRSMLTSLFVPDTDSWGVSELRATMRDKPPFSVGLELKDSAKSAAQAFANSGGCFSEQFMPQAVIDCSSVAGPVSTLYAVVQGGLIGGTLIAAFQMVARVLREGQ